MPESLKNILLVMADGGYLVPPSQDPSKEEIWTETRKRLGRFLPDLFAEIFPDASTEPENSPAPAVPSPQQSGETEQTGEPEQQNEDTEPQQKSGEAEAVNNEVQPPAQKSEEGAS